jgi:hypothetical protein
MWQPEQPSSQMVAKRFFVEVEFVFVIIFPLLVNPKGFFT